MDSAWVYHPWQGGSGPWDSDDGLPLRGNTLLPTPHPERAPTVAAALMLYGDQAYLACRILALSGPALHPEALLSAARAIEHYLKAVLLATRGERPTRTHDLARLARRLGGEFADPEFLALCRRLSRVAAVGRHPDRVLTAWGAPLELLTFLDGFVAHCRRRAGRSPMAFNVIGELLRQETHGDPLLAAAIEAVRRNNRYLAELADPGDGAATAGAAGVTAPAVPD